MNQELAVPPPSDRSTHPPSCVGDSQLQDAQGSPTPLRVFTTARYVDKQEATSTTGLKLLDIAHNDINSHCVDGIAITYGSPRHHLWTYATGLSDNYDNGINNGIPVPSTLVEIPLTFVGLDYYCESGITGRHGKTTIATCS